MRAKCQIVGHQPDSPPSAGALVIDCLDAVRPLRVLTGLLKYMVRQLCHTLNNTVAASPRILIPLIENHQNADGTVTLPEVLRPYFGGREVIGAPVF